ncbi:MAG: WbuC family cupin fold metalloprotein [Candidatus Methanomethyliaceae archaeon]
MRAVVDNELRLAVLIRRHEIRDGLAFYTDPSDFIQVGTWGYSKGTRLPNHIHNKLVRSVERTQELIYVIHGAVRAFVFSEDGRLVEEVVLSQGDMLILLNGGHGYEILDDGTYVLEVKNGPYLGPDKDRRRLQE